MPYKRLHILNTIIFLILLVANAIIYINRDNGYAYKEFASYNQLYQTKEFNYINGFKLLANDTIEIISKSLNPSFTITDFNNKSYSSNGNPRIKLFEGKHTYTLQNINKNNTPLILGFNYVTKKLMRIVGETEALMLNYITAILLLTITLIMKQMTGFKLRNIQPMKK